MRHVGRVVAVATALLLCAGFAIAPWHGIAPDPGHEREWFGQALGAVTFGFVGAAIVERASGPARLVGLLLQVPGLTQAATLVSSSYLHRAAVDGWGGVSGARWVDDWLWVPGPVVGLAILPLIFPDGRALPRLRHLPAAGCGLAVAVTIVVAIQARPGVKDVPALNIGLVAGTAAFALTGLASLAWRLRHGSPTTRRQVRWLAWAVLVLVVLQPVAAQLPPSWAGALLTGLPLLIPLSIGVAVLRFGLYDIDLLLTRTLVYVGVTAALTAMYVLVVVIVEQGASDTSLNVAAILTACIAALVVGPLRTALQRLVEAMLWGAAARPDRAVADLSQQLGTSRSLRESPSIVVHRIADALGVSTVHLLLRDEDGRMTVVARHGEADLGRPDHRVEEPVAYAGRVVGALCVITAGRLEGRRRQLLREMAVAVAPMMDGLLLAAELRSARERVVVARESERTRLHRDLHDGLGPTLGGLVLGVDAARNLVRRDPAGAESALTRLGELAKGATADVRGLVDGLRPAGLEAQGLVPALRFQLGLVDAPPEVAIQNRLAGPLPAAVEVAVFRIVLEGVANVRRHAGARQCLVTLDDVDESVRVTIDDDGRGFAGLRVGGVGLVSMRERAEELGGRAEVGASSFGGVQVRIEIPLSSVRGDP